MTACSLPHSGGITVSSSVAITAERHTTESEQDPLSKWSQEDELVIGAVHWAPRLPLQTDTTGN